MKPSAIFRIIALLGALVFNLPINAQNLSLSAISSTNSLFVSNSLTYTITVTNQSGVAAQNVFVTNTLFVPVPVPFVSASSTQGTLITNSTAGVTFNLGQIVSNGVAQMTFVIRGTAVGFITNAIVATSTSITNTPSTNLVTQVVGPQADLAVSITGPTTGVLVNDWMTYGINVTNLGPNSATSVVLSNISTIFLKVISFSPTNLPFAFTNNALFFDLGTLTNQAFKNIKLTVEPTNAGSATLFASVSSLVITDTNSANNTASTNITIGTLVAGQLIATNLSTMTYNPQTGLMEQIIRLVNVGGSTVASAHVIVSGLTNWLYNSVGTNTLGTTNRNPFVVYAASLSSGQSVDLLLEYFVPTRLPITVPNSAYTAVAAPASNLTPSSVPTPNITQVVNLGASGVLVEFQSITNRTYTILYSDNSSFSNAFTAQPPIVAPADRTQWIDNGPPKTTSHPTNASSRFYRVLLNSN